LLFSVTDYPGGPIEFNFWGNGPGDYTAMLQGGASGSGILFNQGDMEGEIVPEPISICLAVSGLIAIGILRRRGRRAPRSDS
jgi:hypothetical protein